MREWTTFDRLEEQFLREVGLVLAEDDAYPLYVTVLHAHVDTGVVAPSIFKDVGDWVVYREPDLARLTPPLLKLWHLSSLMGRWSEIEYRICGDRFEVRFIQAGDKAKKRFVSDKVRKALLKRYFGNKPVEYPGGHGGSAFAVRFENG